MGVLNYYLKSIRNLTSPEYLFDESSNRHISSLLLLPSILLFLSIVVSMSFGILANKVDITLLIVEVPLLFATLVSFSLHIKKEYLASRVLLIFLFGVVSLFCFYNWGILHYFGILLGLLYLTSLFFTFSPKNNLIFAMVYMLGLCTIGFFQALGLFKYNYGWSPRVFIFDALTVALALVLFAHVVWLYRVAIENKSNKILQLNKKVERSNMILQRRVVEQTAKLMRSRSEYDKSQEILTKAYTNLDASEKDRFEQMNRLSHYALSIAKEIHNIKSSMMYVINKLAKSRIKNEDTLELRTLLTDITSEMDEVLSWTKDYSKVEEFNPSRVIIKCLRILEWKFSINNITPHSFTESSVTIVGDSKKFEQVILNLLDNAIHASTQVENPMVSIVMECTKRYVKIIVSDNGKGVSKKNLKNLFKSFYTTKDSGCGLGLYISKLYIKDFLNGDIRYHREKGITSFIVEIPVYEAQ